MNDYYSKLELHPGVSQEEIKKSFRRLAHIYHPDKPGGDVTKFKEISEAYNFLKDKITPSPSPFQPFYSTQTGFNTERRDTHDFDFCEMLRRTKDIIDMLSKKNSGEFDKILKDFVNKFNL